MLATLLVYWPAVSAGFIWNDSEYVTQPGLRSLAGLGRIWTEVGATEQYYPLLHSVFWLEHRLWGDWPAGYHVTNILLHTLAAGLFARLLLWLAVPGAWLAAFLFALHPVCVESVAWVSEQKNTLSLVFYLGAALAYLRYDEGRRRTSYAWASALFVCALLSKTTTATLPAALLVVAWWRHGRLAWRREVWPLLPWLVGGVATGLFSAWVERKFIGAEGEAFTLSLVERGLLAGRVIWFYLGKLAWPADLIFIYPRWSVDAALVGQWLWPIGVVLVLAGLWLIRRRACAPLAAALLFVGSLFPVLGFFNVYAFVFSYVADHWQYLPSLALIALAAAGLVRVPAVVGVVIVAALGGLSWRQCTLYRDMETFYRVTLEKNPACWMAHNNLGNLLRDSGRPAEAVEHFKATLRVKPDSPKAHNNLGNVLHDQRRPAEALSHYEQAVALSPAVAEYHDNLATVLREVGRLEAALVQHRGALLLDPEAHAAHNNYGVTLRAAGRPAEAIAQFEAATRLEPRSAPAHLNLALSYSQAGRTAEAIDHYREARRLNPALPAVETVFPSVR